MHIPTGIYRHYRGQDYEVIGNAIHTESREWMVVYKALYPTPELPDGTMFVRPAEQFTSTVEVDGTYVKRFQKITNP